MGLKIHENTHSETKLWSPCVQAQQLYKRVIVKQFFPEILYMSKKRLL